MGGKLSRLLRPQSIAVFGGGWAANVVKQLQKAGYSGQLWPVNPNRDRLCGLPCYQHVDDLPAAPDASFVGVNRELTIDLVGRLAAKGAGGAVCFASGFLESEAEDSRGAELQQQLLKAAGDMPILGPNCYGLINYLDTVPLWPDEHGGRTVERGVAIIAQSSNIALNLTMQQRGLPIAYLLTAGNQAQTDVATIAAAVLDDERVTAVGFYLEGFGDVASFQALAEHARGLGKSLVALKSGKSMAARIANVSHTASLAGSEAASSALLQRLGIVEVHSLDVLLDTLNILHHYGPLENSSINSVSCSGGEAALMADTGDALELQYKPFSEAVRTELSDCLGPLVAIANPLDYHTYIWGDVATMARCFSAVTGTPAAMTVFVLDVPRSDLCDPAAWECAIEAISQASQQANGAVAVASSIADCMPESLAQKIIEAGCVPLSGIDIGLRAIAAAARAGELAASELRAGLLVARPRREQQKVETTLLSEFAAKQALTRFGVSTPGAQFFDNHEALLLSVDTLQYPCVLKAQGLAHKSEQGAVLLNLQSADELRTAALDLHERLQGEYQGLLVETMVDDSLVELLVGITRDASGLLVLTIAAGGISTELMSDSSTQLLPTSAPAILTALRQLRCYPLLEGYRAKPAANLESVVNAVLAIAACAEAQADKLLELEVNPLVCGQEAAVAVDAILRLEN